MSVMGQERTSAALDFMSALPPITDINPRMSAFGGKADEKGSKADIKLLMSVFSLITSVVGGKADIIRVGDYVRF